MKKSGQGSTYAQADERRLCAVERKLISDRWDTTIPLRNCKISFQVKKNVKQNNFRRDFYLECSWEYSSQNWSRIILDHSVWFWGDGKKYRF